MICEREFEFLHPRAVQACCLLMFVKARKPIGRKEMRCADCGAQYRRDAEGTWRAQEAAHERSA